MVSFATTAINPEEFDETISILRDHYNSLVPESKALTTQMFEAIRSKQPVSDSK